MRQKHLQPAIAVVASLAIGAAACPDAAPAPPQNQPPVAVAGGHYAGQDTIHFDGRSSYDADGDLPLVYHWDFGDGSTDTGATAAHLYTSDGGYTVTLTVTDARGAWHVIVLNSNGGFVPFNAGSAQDQWLQADLAANTRKCILATWHHARFFSSSDPGFTSSAPIKILWDRLYAAGADVVLHAYLHHYQRLAPMTQVATVDSASGIRDV